MLKYHVEYEPLSAQEYESHYREQQIKYLVKKAVKFGFRLAPVGTVSKNALLAGFLFCNTLLAVKNRYTLVIHDNDAIRGDFAFRHLERHRDRAIGK
jgi:hypothetical protein